MYALPKLAWQVKLYFCICAGIGLVVGGTLVWAVIKLVQHVTG